MTWTASLKRTMHKMLSKGSSSRRNSKTTEHSAAAAVAAVAAASTAGNPPGAKQLSGDPSATPSSPPGAPRSPATGMATNLRGIAMHAREVSPFKGFSQSPFSAMLSPSGSNADASSKLSGSVLRGNDAAQSLFGSDATQAWYAKQSQDPPAALTGQGRPAALALGSAASLPASGLRGMPQPSSNKGTPVGPSQEGNAPGMSHFQGQAFGAKLAPQPSQPVQTVQEMLAAMQQQRQHNTRESSPSNLQPPSNGKTCPRALSVGDDGTGPEGRGRQGAAGGSQTARDSRTMASPFADSLLNKPYTNAISRRYAMAGTTSEQLFVDHHPPRCFCQSVRA